MGFVSESQIRTRLAAGGKWIRTARTKTHLFVEAQVWPFGRRLDDAVV